MPTCARSHRTPRRGDSRCADTQCAAHQSPVVVARSFRGNGREPRLLRTVRRLHPDFREDRRCRDRLVHAARVSEKRILYRTLTRARELGCRHRLAARGARRTPRASLRDTDHRHRIGYPAVPFPHLDVHGGRPGLDDVASGVSCGIHVASRVGRNSPMVSAAHCGAAPRASAEVASTPVEQLTIAAASVALEPIEDTAVRRIEHQRERAVRCDEAMRRVAVDRTVRDAGRVGRHVFERSDAPDDPTVPDIDAVDVPGRIAPFVDRDDHDVAKLDSAFDLARKLDRDPSLTSSRRPADSATGGPPYCTNVVSRMPSRSR